MMNFGQLLTAMVTPFDPQGNIDFPATKSLINYLLNNGTDGLVVAGTTGESPTLTMEEKTALFQYVVQVVDGRVPVIAGTGTNSTAESIHLTQIADHCGVDGVMLVTPYYNKPSQEGIFQHTKAIAESTHLPVMLYNIPGRCSVNMSEDTAIRLSQIQNIVAIKEASGDLDAIANIIQGTPEEFYVYSGDDSLALAIMSIGGHGVVSVASHIIGNEMSDMIKAVQQGNIPSASKLHRELLSLMKALFAAPNPTPVKAALEMQGIHAGSVRLPLVPLTDQEARALHQAIQPKLLFEAI